MGDTDKNHVAKVPPPIVVMSGKVSPVCNAAPSY